MTRNEIEADLLGWMRTEPELEDDARFERLALELFAWQFEHCLPYARFSAGRGAGPDKVSRWQEIPTVPTGAFKEVPLRCFAADQEIKTFRTSGTSHASASRGELHLDTLALYEASLVASFERGLLGDLEANARLPIWILAPSAEEAPDSSLSHMFSVMKERRGSTGSGFFVRNGALESERLYEAAWEIDEPVLLCGTAFSFVHWLEDLDERDMDMDLPAGTRLMETGGFKGKTRERSRGELYAELEVRLGIPQQRIINQYGMTELGSQFYDVGLTEPGADHKRIPPWVRVRIVDPVTGQEARDGELGMIEIVDLANTGSVAAIATADLGRRVDAGFVIEGRDAEAEARGCSIAADEMLRSDD